MLSLTWGLWTKSGGQDHDHDQYDDNNISIGSFLGTRLKVPKYLLYSRCSPPLHVAAVVIGLPTLLNTLVLLIPGIQIVIQYILYLPCWFVVE